MSNITNAFLISCALYGCAVDNALMQVTYHRDCGGNPHVSFCR